MNPPEVDTAERPLVLVWEVARACDLSGAGLARMALSLDGGSAAAHDEFRGEAGSFEATLRAAAVARNAGLLLQINTTVCADTVAELPAIRDLVADLGAVLWSVFFLVPVGRGRVFDPVSPERTDRVMEWLCEVRESEPFGVKTTEAPQFRRVAIQRRRERAGGAGDADDSPGGVAAESDGSSTDATGGPGRRTGVRAGAGRRGIPLAPERLPACR